VTVLGSNDAREFGSVFKLCCKASRSSLWAGPRGEDRFRNALDRMLRVHCNAACRIDIHTQAAITALALTARSLPVRVLPATRFSALQSCPQRVPCLVRCSGGHRRLSAEDPSVLRHGDREYSAEQSCVLRISQLHCTRTRLLVSTY